MDPTPSGWPGGNGLRRWSVWCVWSLTMGGDVMDDVRETADAWAAEVEAAWKWLEASAGWQWASADQEADDGGPTESDLRGEVQHGG